jgi:O-antigen/teichoic acid export membrane protein
MAIPNIYGENYSLESIVLGQKIFVVFMFSTVLHMMTDAFSGCIVGHEKFTVNSSVQFLRTLLKIFLWVVLLKLGKGVLAITCVDLVISLTTFLFSVGYAVFALHEKPKLYYLDRKKLWEIVSFGAAILLQAVVNQVNNNVDNIILGACVTEKAVITMYSSALSIYVVYNSLVSVIANFFLPQATRLINKNASGEELTDFVIAPGRFQALLAVACILGFALFGRNFISIWIGAKYMDAYWVTLMLMIPVTVPLVENTMIPVLDASLKRIYRSVTLVIMAALNVVLSLLLVSALGFWGVAIGTVASLVIGHGFLMNIYYAKTFNLQLGRMFYSIFKGILPAGLAAGILCIPLALFVPDTTVLFLVKCASFMLLYGIFLFLFGLNASEKSMILKILKIKSR